MVRKNLIAASLRSTHLKPRVVRVKKGRGSYSRKPKHQGDSQGRPDRFWEWGLKLYQTTIIDYKRVVIKGTSHVSHQQEAS